MSNRFRHIFLLCGFLAIIYVPIIDQQFGITVILFPSSENRELSKIPEFNPRLIKKYVNAFDKYYRDNFGLRNPLFYSYSKFKLDFLNTSPLPDKVVVGKNEWLFLGNSFANVINKALGLDLFTTEELNKLATDIQKNRSWLKERNIKYYLVIAPDKHTVYSEYLPNNIPSQNTGSKLLQLDKFLKSEINFQLVDLKSGLDTLKDSIRLYHKTDSHWNELGAFFGYRTLMTNIKEDFPNTNVFSIDDFNIDTIYTYQKGLSKMLNLRIKEEEIRLKLKSGPFAKMEDKNLTVPKWYKGIPYMYEYRYTCNKRNDKLKVLIFRDSFLTAMTPFLSESFSESVLIWHPRFDKDIILKEKPDIVITQLVERSIDALQHVNQH